MSDTDNSDKTIEMISKLNKLNKQTKGIADTLQKIMEKLDSKDAKTQDEVKEEVSKAFEKKGVGRPIGSHSDKRQQYFKMLTDGKIKNPKEMTLQYYNIQKNPETDAYELLK